MTGTTIGGHTAWRSGTDRIWIVAVASSAGGLEATTTLLGALDPSLPAAIIVVNHCSPDYPDRLKSLLQKRCSFDVVTATDCATLVAGAAFVVPAGRHAIVASTGRLRVVRSNGFPPSRPSADLLLTSMGVAVPTKSIGVILSGSGHDGATGATVLHQLGGTVVASDEATSTYFAMPSAAIARGAADIVMPLTEIADYLTSVIGDAAPTTQPNMHVTAG
jgi:two-component system chemotaxis response regulator CheB